MSALLLLAAAPDATTASIRALSSTVHQATAAAPTDPSTTNLTKWLKDNVVQLLFLLIGISILFAGYKGSASKVMMTAGLSLVGLLWIGMATTGSINNVSAWLLGLVGISS